MTMFTEIPDATLDREILAALFPDEARTEIDLSVHIENSGGAIRTALRCHDLQERKLLYSSYQVKDPLCSYWRLTVRGKWEVQKNHKEESQ